MKFREKEPIERLIQKKPVATMRNYAYQCGNYVNLELISDEYYIGKAEILAVFKNLEIFRKLTWKMSGYPSVEAWEEAGFRQSFNKRLPQFIIIIKPIFIQRVAEIPEEQTDFRRADELIEEDLRFDVDINSTSQD